VKVIKIIGAMVVTTGLVSACSSSSTSSVENNFSTLSGSARCEAFAGLSSKNVDLEIRESTYISSPQDLDAKINRLNPAQVAGFKPYCKLTGFFEKRTGADNLPYAIGFGLSLPDDWNGKFLFQGGGGLNGLIREPLGSTAAGDVPALFRGFAVASTDGGHQSNTVFDPSFFADQRALLNFYAGAVEKSTQVALELLETVYQQSPKQRYFVGCSTGGREAMTMSQRFPELFDGIIVGAPARQTNYSEIADLWSAKRLRLASNDQQTPPFSTVQQQAIVTEVLAQCDATDGLADGLIFDVEGCDFKAEKLLCETNSASNACLNQGQVSALKDAFAGPRSQSGEQVYPGFYFDTGIAATGQRSVPGLLQAVPGPLGAQFINEPFDINKQLAIAKNFPLAGGNALLTNLTTFAHNGGKIMFFHGVSDPWFSAKDTLQYYQAMLADNGGDAATNWSQFYFVPGMGHCGGGEQTLDNFDMLTKLDNWVENQQQPTSVVATGQSMPGISRPLCPYPQIPFYTGQGDAQLASAFECRNPQQ
jgi:pimeloyl-ACP methyl ester carboxylesterase